MKTLTFKLYLNQAEKQTIEQWLSALRWVWNEGLGMLIENEKHFAYVKPTKLAISIDDRERLERAKRIYGTDPTHLGEIKEGNLTLTTPAARVPCCPMRWQYRWQLKKQTSPVIEEILREIKGYQQDLESAQTLEKRQLLLAILSVREEELERRLQKEKKEWIAIPYSPIASRRPYRQFCPIPEQRTDEFYENPRIDQPSFFSLSKYFAHKNHPDKPWLQAVPANFIRGTLHSLANAWTKYKSGKTGQPRFKRKGDTGGTLIHEDGASIGVEGENVRIPKLGLFRARHLLEEWRDTPIKVLKVAKLTTGYYLQLTGDVPVKAVKPRVQKGGLVLPQKQGVLYVDDRSKEVKALPEDAKLLTKLDRLQKQLSRQTYLGQNWQKTKQKIAAIHEKLRLRAKNHNHKMSTFAVRKFGEIAVQEIKPGTLPKPDPIVASVEPPKYDPNGATRIAEINQQRAALRVGQFVELVKQKSATHDRRFVKVKAAKSDKKHEIIAQEIRSTL